MAEVEHIVKLPQKNLWRIKKKAKYDFGESYTQLHQRHDLLVTTESQKPPVNIDNIYLLKHFSVDVEVKNSSGKSTLEHLVIQHCKETDLGIQLGISNVQDIAYSEDGKIFLDPAYKCPYVYGNLRAGDFNRVHVLTGP